MNSSIYGLYIMKAAVVTKLKEPLEIKEVPIPVPGPHDVLVKMLATGVCHSDLHVALGDLDLAMQLGTDRIPGHEGVGRIIELGSDRITHLQVGDIVGVPFLRTACLHCEYCITGREYLCWSQVNSGFFVDGTFAEYALTDSRFAVKLSSTLDPILAAPVFCAGVTSYKAIKISEVHAGQWIAIFGIGGLGHLAIQYAKTMGINVIAVVLPGDTQAATLAKDCGADLVYQGHNSQASAFIQKEVGGAEAAVITVGAVEAYHQGFLSLKRGGRLICVGIPTEKIEVSVLDMVFMGIKLVSSVIGSRKDLQEALEFVDQGKVKPVVTKKKLEDINLILEELKQGNARGRYVIDFQ